MTEKVNSMSEIPGDLKFLKSHEWVQSQADGTVRVGISDHAQAELGDLVYVELPNVGDTLKADSQCAVVESVKAASDVYAPVSGEVIAVNEDLVDAPEKVNDSPYDEGWLFTIQPSATEELTRLLDADAYGATLDS